MKNRTIIGIVCIVLALVVTFAVAPLVNKLSDSRTDIVRLKNDIDQGHMIQESDIEVVTVGSTGLPTNIITKKEAVVGKFAACDLKANTDLLQSMISDKSDSADDVFHTLDGKKQAISITISSFAGGLSGKLENGDTRLPFSRHRQIARKGRSARKRQMPSALRTARRFVWPSRIRRTATSSIRGSRSRSCRCSISLPLTPPRARKRRI